MEMNTALISFSETTQTEVARLSAEMRINSLLRVLAAGGEITDVQRADLGHQMQVLADLFSVDVPGVEADPMQMLSKAARDIRLGALLKERGLARIYRMVTLQAEAWDEATGQRVLLPAFMLETNPDTGQRFANQEELLGWFCREARVSRALVFMRVRTYDRLLDIGHTMEEAFQVVLQKPYAAREALNAVATWDKGELVDIDPDVAMRLARKMLPGQVEEVAALIEEMQEGASPQEAHDAFLETMKPALKQLTREVAEHASMRDAMATVRHDIASRPEIRFFYDRDRGWVRMETVNKAVDIAGTEYIAEVQVNHLVPETPLTQEQLDLLAEKLAFGNRGELLA